MFWFLYGNCVWNQNWVSSCSSWPVSSDEFLLQRNWFEIRKWFSKWIWRISFGLPTNRSSCSTWEIFVFLILHHKTTRTTCLLNIQKLIINNTYVFFRYLMMTRNIAALATSKPTIIRDGMTMSKSVSFSTIFVPI